LALYETQKDKGRAFCSQQSITSQVINQVENGLVNSKIDVRWLKITQNGLFCVYR
jgi:hypothetical protein